MASKKLNAKQMQAVELLAKGFEQKQVASLIGVHEDTVYRWMKDTDFRRLVQEKAKSFIADYVPENLQIILNLARTAQKESVRLNAARELLYMAGMKPVEKVEQVGDTVIKVGIEDEPEDTA